jgi:UDPglucose--hexose-1-phosphate uridylyltransferase
MPELRKDYITDTWVIFAPVRSQRPIAGTASRRTTDPESCPFCEGHEHLTPPETYALRDGPRDSPGWRVRCVPNRYPALEPIGPVDRSSEAMFGRVSGVGSHEVIVEAPDHGGHLGLMGDDQVGRVVRAYRERIRDLSGDPRTRYVLVFKNHGERAGASISHPHSQLIAMPIVPQRIVEEVEGARRHASANPGGCGFCEVLEAELADGRRIIARDDAFVALSPFAARFPFETWIAPRAHAAAFESLDDAGSTRFARILKDVLARLYVVLNDPDLNFYIHTAPVGAPADSFHWHVEVTPRLAEIAGFERGTGMFINQVMPEDAAAILRGSVRAAGHP